LRTKESSVEHVEHEEDQKVYSITEALQYCMPKRAACNFGA